MITCSGGSGRPIVVNEGESVKCLCSSIGGNPIPYASWTKDNHTDTINGNTPLTNELVLKKISKTDKGKYKCKVNSVELFDEKEINILVRCECVTI